MESIFLDKSRIVECNSDIDKDQSIMLLIQHAKTIGLISDLNVTIEEVFKRESLGSTGIGDGVAIPHAKLDNIEGVHIVFGYFPRGVEFDSIDGGKVYYMFLILSESRKTALHLKTLSGISRLIKNTTFLEKMKTVENIDDIYYAINSAWSEIL